MLFVCPIYSHIYFIIIYLYIYYISYSFPVMVYHRILKIVLMLSIRTFVVYPLLYNSLHLLIWKLPVQPPPAGPPLWQLHACSLCL